MDSTLHVERNFRKQGNWDGVPSGWYVGTLTNQPGYSGNNQVSDKLYIDGGQDWYVTGRIAAVEEIMGLLNQE